MAEGVLVHFDGHHFGSCLPTGEEENVVELVDGPDESEEKKDGQNRSKLRHRDVDESLHRGRAVHRCSLVEFFGNALKAGQDKEESKREVAPAFKENDGSQGKRETPCPSQKIEFHPPLGKERDGLADEPFVDGQPVQHAELRVKDETPCECDRHNRGDVRRDEKTPDKASARELGVDKKGGCKSEQNGQDTAAERVDQGGGEDLGKIRVLENFAEILEGQIDMPQGGSPEIREGHGLETEPDVPQDRKNNKGKDHGKRGNHHPEGKTALSLGQRGYR